MTNAELQLVQSISLEIGVLDVTQFREWLRQWCAKHTWWLETKHFANQEEIYIKRNCLECQHEIIVFFIAEPCKTDYQNLLYAVQWALDYDKETMDEKD